MPWPRKKEMNFRDRTARMIMMRLEGDKHRKIQVAYAIISDMENAGWSKNDD